LNRFNFPKFQCRFFWLRNFLPASNQGTRHQYDNCPFSSAFGLQSQKLYPRKFLVS